MVAHAFVLFLRKSAVGQTGSLSIYYPRRLFAKPIAEVEAPSCLLSFGHLRNRTRTDAISLKIVLAVRIEIYAHYL